MVIDARDLHGLRPADRLQLELAEADEHLHHLFGTDESAWLPWQVAAYAAAIDAIWAGGPGPTVAVMAA